MLSNGLETARNIFAQAQEIRHEHRQLEGMVPARGLSRQAAYRRRRRQLLHRHRRIPRAQDRASADLLVKLPRFAEHFDAGKLGGRIGPLVFGLVPLSVFHGLEVDADPRDRFGQFVAQVQRLIGQNFKRVRLLRVRGGSQARPCGPDVAPSSIPMESPVVTAYTSVVPRREEKTRQPDQYAAARRLARATTTKPRTSPCARNCVSTELNSIHRPASD
jgi:hypothetical protein